MESSSENFVDFWCKINIWSFQRVVENIIFLPTVKSCYDLRLQYWKVLLKIFVLKLATYLSVLRKKNLCISGAKPKFLTLSMLYI